MAKCSHVNNRSAFCRYLLLFAAFLTFLGLLSGCDIRAQISTRIFKGTVNEFPLPASNTPSGGITAGPDGNLWFTEITLDDHSSTNFTGKIGRITPSGTISEFSLPTRNSPPGGITVGPDGNLWFTEQQNGNVRGKIGRITPSGMISEFSLPSTDSPSYGITPGPDGALWFTEDAGQGGKIGRITPSGTISEFSLPAPAYTHGQPGSITTGPDGALWFTETIIIINVQSSQTKLVGKIGRITPTGQLREFLLPTPESQPNSITAGPDGNLWFTESFINGPNNKIGRITPAGHISEFSLPTRNGLPGFGGMTRGPDGALWFTEFVATAQSGKVVGKIGRITPTGQISEFSLPAPEDVPFSITTGPDGALWFATAQSGKFGGKIGRLA